MSNEKLDFAKLYEEACNKQVLSEKIAALELLKKQFEAQYKNITNKVLDRTLPPIAKPNFELYCEISLTLIQSLDENDQTKLAVTHGKQVLASVCRLLDCYEPKNYKNIKDLIQKHKKIFPDLALSLANILAVIARIYGAEKKNAEALEYFQNALSLLECRFGKILEQNAETVMKENRALRDTFNNIALAKADFLCTFDLHADLPNGVTRQVAPEIYLRLIKWINSSSEKYTNEEQLPMIFNIAVNLRKEAMELQRSNNLQTAAKKFMESADYDKQFILDSRNDSEKLDEDNDCFTLSEDFIKNLLEASAIVSNNAQNADTTNADFVMWRLFVAFVATAEQFEAMLKMPSYKMFHMSSFEEKFNQLKTSPEQIEKLNKIANLPEYAELLKKLAKKPALAAKAPVTQESKSPAVVQSVDKAPVSAPSPVSTPAAPAPTGDATPKVQRKRFTFVPAGTPSAATTPSPVIVAPAPVSAPAPKPASVSAPVSVSSPAPAPEPTLVPTPVSAPASAPSPAPKSALAKARYQPRNQEFFIPVKDDHLKADVVIEKWTELDDDIYHAARIFNKAFNSGSSNSGKFQKVDNNGCLLYKIVIEPPAHLSLADKLAYGKRIKERLDREYTIRRNIHLQDKSNKAERYNEYFIRNIKDKETGVCKPKKIGNILAADAVDGTVAVYGSTASLLTAIVAKNHPTAPKPAAQVASQPEVEASASQEQVVDKNNSVAPRSESPAPSPEKSARSKKAKEPAETKIELLEQDKNPAKKAKVKKNGVDDQKAIDRRAKALFQTSFKQALTEIRFSDAAEQITGVDLMVEMYINAQFNGGKVSHHVVNMLVAALILKIDALMLMEQYQQVINAIDALKEGHSDHNKYKEEAARLAELYKNAQALLGHVHHAEPEQQEQELVVSSRKSPTPTSEEELSPPEKKSRVDEEKESAPVNVVENEKRDNEDDQASASKKRPVEEQPEAAIASPPKKPAEEKESSGSSNDQAKRYYEWKFFKKSSASLSPATAPAPAPTPTPAPAPEAIKPSRFKNAKKSSGSRVGSQPKPASAPAPRKRGERTDQMRLLSSTPGKKVKGPEEDRTNDNTPKK